MKHYVRLLAALALGCVPSFVFAQLGSGWSSTTETFTTQTSSGCSVTSISGGYQFYIPTGVLRAEHRYANIPSGSEQFQGTVKVTSLPGDKICVKQTFQQDNGPWQMLAVRKSDSAFYDVEASGQPKLYGFTVGTSYQVNTILNSAHTSVNVYINGSLVRTDTGASGAIYNKCGAYSTGSGTGPCTSQWTNVKTWHGGSAP